MWLAGVNKVFFSQWILLKVEFLNYGSKRKYLYKQIQIFIFNKHTGVKPRFC